MQFAGIRQAFDGYDFATLILDGQSQTGIDTLTVYQDRARPTGTLIAALLRSSKMQVIAQCVEK